MKKRFKPVAMMNNKKRIWKQTKEFFLTPYGVCGEDERHQLNIISMHENTFREIMYVCMTTLNHKSFKITEKLCFAI